MKVKVISKLEMRKLGLKTSHVHIMILKNHKECMMNNSNPIISFEKGNYMVECDNCVIPMQNERLV